MVIVGSNINSNIIGLPPMPGNSQKVITVIPNKTYYFGNPGNMNSGFWYNNLTGKVTTGYSDGSAQGNLLDSLNPLSSLNPILEKVQDRSFWYTAIALIVGVILAIVALNGLVMQESGKIMKAGLK